MLALSAISFALLVLASWVVGIRLLKLHQRTRELPELCLGLTTLLLTGIGYPLAMGEQLEPYLGLTGAKVTQNFSNLCIDVSLALVFLFTWKVFRPRARWAPLMLLGGSALLLLHGVAVAFALIPLQSMSESMAATRMWAALGLSAGVVAYLWTGCESLLYWMQLRRRLDIGLCDPVVVNRMALWSAMSVVVAAGASANVYWLLRGVDVLSSAPALLTASTAGTIQAVLLYLTFLPPRSYLAWVNGQRGYAES